MECFVAYPSIYDSYIYIYTAKYVCWNILHKQTMLFSSTAIRWLVQICRHRTARVNVSFGVGHFWLESFLFESPPNNDCCRVFVWKESNLLFSRFCVNPGAIPPLLRGIFQPLGNKMTLNLLSPLFAFFFSMCRKNCHSIYNGKSIPPKVRRLIFWKHPILNLYFSFDIHEAFDFRRYFQCDSGALGLFFEWIGGKGIDGGAAEVLEDDSS